MSDFSAVGQIAIQNALAADTGVKAAFGYAPVKIFDIPPKDAKPPYLTLGVGDIVTPIMAEGFDLSELETRVHVWSLTNPPSLIEAKRMGAAVGAALAAQQLVVGARLYSVTTLNATYLVDPSDNRTAHGVIAVRLTLAPA